MHFSVCLLFSLALQDKISVFSLYILLCFILDPGGNYHNSSGILKSPGYPYGYQNEKECIYTISVAENNIIKIVFSEFDLEHHDDCGNDFLEFRDGDSEFSPFLEKICGIKSKIIYSSQTKMWIR